MKRFLLLVAIVGLSASLGAQSLTELARREKARREGFKGRHAVVIRNADLLRVQKVPAVEVVKADEEFGEGIPGESQVALQIESPSESENEVLPSGSGAPSGRRTTPRVAPAGPVLMGGEEGAGELAASGGPLEAQLRAAKDLVDLLTTKMNALRQEYEYQDAMVPGYVIQQQLDETNKRLLKAQAQQARIEAQLEKRTAGKKGSSDIDR